MTAEKKELNWFERFAINKLMLNYKYEDTLSVEENQKRNIIYDTNTLFDIPFIGIGLYCLWKKGIIK